MILAGDVAQGSKATTDAGRVQPSRPPAQPMRDPKRGRAIGNASQPGLALLVSCIGRRLLMGQRTESENPGGRRSTDPGYHTVGFYSYGEIAPHAVSGVCELHNQTMTIT